MNLSEKRSALRAMEVKSRRKMSRNRSKGVELKGSRHDPTMGADVGRLSSRQIDARMARNERFLSRKNQFVGVTKSGEPIPASKWRGYKRAEKIHNRVIAGEYDQVKNLKLPGSIDSVDDRHNRMRTKRPNLPVNDNYSAPRDAKPNQFISLAKMGDHRRWLINSAPTKFERDVQTARGAALKAIEQMGSNAPEGWEDLLALDDRRFMLVWAHTSASTSFFVVYDGNQTGYRLNESIYQDARSSVNETVSWAKSVKIK